MFSLRDFDNKKPKIKYFKKYPTKPKSNESELPDLFI